MEIKKINFKNAIVYPYGYEFAPILYGLLKQKQIDNSVTLISPVGWGLNGLDAGEALGRSKIGIKISNLDFMEAARDSNSYIVAPFGDFEDIKYNEILNNEIKNNIRNAKASGLGIIDLRQPLIYSEDQKDIKKYKKNELSVPVVFVNGVMENVNKLDVQFELGFSLRKKGYKVAQIGTRSYCNVLGMYPFPLFMFDTIHEIEKVNMFKSFVTNICIQDKPDVIIIGIPGGSMPFNDDVPNGYGILNYLASMAVRADYTITCTNFEYWDTKELSKLYYYRFGHQIDAIVMSNLKVTYDPLETPEKLLLEKLDHTKIHDLISNYPLKSEIPLFDIFNQNDVEGMTNHLIDSLGKTEYFAV